VNFGRVLTVPHSVRFSPRVFAILLLSLLFAVACDRSAQWADPPTRAGGPATGSTGPQPDHETTITIVGSGDVLLHPDLWDQAHEDAGAEGRDGYDFEPLFEGVRDVVSGADLAICHMEPPLAAENGPFIGFPRFSVPPQVVPALADIGYDSCSTASNHSIDHGEEGIKNTLDALDASHIRHAGTARTPAEHNTITVLTVNGVKIAHLSYAFGFNGLKRPSGKEWEANLIDKQAILAEAHRARAAGAAIVVLSLHWGTEYSHQLNSQQRSLAPQLLASPDIDLILGHHAHVVQPFEKIGDKWVAYGHGNEVAHHAQPINDNREGILSRFTFSQVSPGKWRVTKAEAIPIWMQLSPDDRLLNLANAIADPATSASAKRTYQAAYDRIKSYVDALGADQDGLLIP